MIAMKATHCTTSCKLSCWNHQSSNTIEIHPKRSPFPSHILSFIIREVPSERVDKFSNNNSQKSVTSITHIWSFGSHSPHISQVTSHLSCPKSRKLPAKSVVLVTWSVRELITSEERSNETKTTTTTKYEEKHHTAKCFSSNRAQRCWSWEPNTGACFFLIT